MSRPTPPIVAVDGPSGVGKSSVARRLAARLGLPFVDTGAMYRCVAWTALQQGIDPEDAESIGGLLAEIDLALAFEGDQVRLSLGGRVVGEEIRTPEVSMATSQVARHASVRSWLVTLQRRFGAIYGGVLEGRDIGTVVFPDTPDKFFLDADPATRARRRTLQLAAGGADADQATVQSELEARDRNDSERAHAPLRCDDSYRRVDTTDLTEDQVVDLLERLVRDRAAD